MRSMTEGEIGDAPSRFRALWPAFQGVRVAIGGVRENVAAATRRRNQSAA